jgi:hypothetical protein
MNLIKKFPTAALVVGLFLFFLFCKAISNK